MKNPIIYILIIFLFTSSCNNNVEDFVTENSKTQIKLLHGNFQSKAVDDDNLEDEQKIINLSIFLTEPGSDEFFYSAVRNVAFSDIDDYRLVTLPLNLSTLGRKDIYVVTNLENSSLNQAKNLTELKKLSTPTASKSNNLNPQNGFCMFGQTLDFDFNNEAGEPAKVYAVRTCAKYRFTLTFPQNPTLSTSNAFLIKDAASNTCIGEKEKANPKYFTFSTPIPLHLTEANTYSNITYVYESEKAPKLGLYLNYSNSSSYVDYEADLPVPQRNYLYDIDIEVHDIQTKSSSDTNQKYRFNTTITTYDEGGNRIKKAISK